MVAESPLRALAQQTALWALGVHVPPVRQDERQLTDTTLQESPQVLCYKLIPLVREVQAVREVDREVLRKQFLYVTNDRFESVANVVLNGKCVVLILN